MNAVTSKRVQQVWRRPKLGLIGMLTTAVVQFGMDHLDIIFRGLRFAFPICDLGWMVVTRNDDVREVLLGNVPFSVEQTKRLSREMDYVPFMLGEDDLAEFRRVEAPLRAAMKSDDIPVLAKRCGERVAELARQSGGRLEVVDLIWQVTFEVFGDYIGVTAPKGHDLRVAAARIYDFQVTPFKVKAVTREAVKNAKALQAHIDGLVAAAKTDGSQKDDLLHRLVRQQKPDGSAPKDLEIRANLMGMIIALPQLPIAAPYALNQLLARPIELEPAQESARANDEAALKGYIFEALRFDPMAPFLLRRCAEDHKIASGARRAKTIKKGKVVLAALQSAMKDPRRVTEPETFDPRRPWSEYLLFGDGLHTCFIEQMNKHLFPAMLKPLLACEGLAREGELRKRTPFADQLWVTFEPPSLAAPLAPTSKQPELAPA